MSNDYLERLELPEPAMTAFVDKTQEIEWLFTESQLRAAIHADRQRRAQAAEPVGYIEPRHLEFLRTQIAKETRSVFIKNAKDELRTIPLYTRAAPAEVTDAMRLLSAEDMRWLRRFQDICEDSGADGHDVPKNAMRRLEKIGVVRSCGFGRHETTAFGDYILEAALGGGDA